MTQKAKENFLELRDPVHGPIHISEEVVPVLASDFFQRLRNIRQLGLVYMVFPGASHSRYLHSIGMMHIGKRCFDKLFSPILPERELLRLKSTFELACLLHDVGHPPLGHSTELAMPMVSELDIPNHILKIKKDRRATHEDYSVKAIVDSSLSESFHKAHQMYGVQKERIADFILGETPEPSYYQVGEVNYFPILQQLVSSELDCDRMDYLLRDSYFCGVNYGNYDLNWLIENLEIVREENMAYLGINERAIITFDDFLLSRYHMFIMVYFHYRCVCLEQLLLRYFESAKEEYSVPADIELYADHDDYHLMKCIKNSQNRYAKLVSKNKIPPKIYESFNKEQSKKLSEIQAFLDKEGIEYIRSSSLGTFSKYHNPLNQDSFHPIKVTRKYYKSSKKTFATLSEATDIFQKFKQDREVNRLHCYMDELTSATQKKIYQLIGPSS